MRRLIKKTILLGTIFLLQAAFMGGRLFAVPESLGGITLLSISPRIVTPNGDNFNDVIYFQFDTALTGLPIEGVIHDINGARVSDMTLNSDDTALLWNGRNEAGRVVPAGIYVYSIKIGKSRATGTVVVAR